MRRRPTAVYRVLDEDDLLYGSDYLDAGQDPAEHDGRVDPAAVDPVDRGDPDDQVDPSDAGLGRPSGDGPPGRRHMLIACAGALILAVLVARLASILLAGTGTPRSGRWPSGRRPGTPAVAARGLVAVPSSNGGAPPADRLTVPPGVAPGPTTFRPVGPARSVRAIPSPARDRRVRAVPSPARDRRVRAVPSPARDRRVRAVPSPAQDRRVRAVPSPAEDRRAQSAPSRARVRPARPGPSPAQDRPALDRAPLAAEREFGFER